ncbi:hypothetical protein ACFWDI_06335 [Streptomyces sp. NPDC060064]|uniref:hypothetical protein n=1 Tax=Streptomyces sp. NPDC060064 TaxID=3347049 RepID=UPI0036A814E6
MTFENYTSCTLQLQERSIQEGTWTDDPETQIAPADSTEMRTESDEMQRGTEASVTYEMVNCKSETLEGQMVTFEWSNPFYGDNSYEFEHTSGGVHTYYASDDPNAAHAAVTAQVSEPA